ncbi:MAG: peptidoglycan editing factor PgeF [Caldimonas sp.]
MTLPPGWLAPDWAGGGVGALMSTRDGGISTGPHASMNLGDACGDDPACVAANRARFAATCAAAPIFLRQVHGARVVRVGAEDARAGSPRHAADASLSTEPGVACTVLVADCLPVLFAAPGGRGVAAAHAGWRGLSAGVLEAAVAALCEAAGCRPVDLDAWLGACIGPAAFEVGADVVEAFGVDPGAAGTRHFAPARPGKWLADLAGLARDRLGAAGLVRLGGADRCVVADPSRFFSYRRDGVTGRMAAAVWIAAGAGRRGRLDAAARPSPARRGQQVEGDPERQGTVEQEGDARTEPGSAVRHPLDERHQDDHVEPGDGDQIHFCARRFSGSAPR